MNLQTNNLQARAFGKGGPAQKDLKESVQMSDFQFSMVGKKDGTR